MTKRLKKVQYANALENGVIYYSNELSSSIVYETTINETGKGVPVVTAILTLFGAFDFVQLIFVSKPTNKELEVVIEAIRFFDEKEYNFEI